MAAFVVFLPGVFGEFLNWDDDKNFTEHPHYRGLGLPQLSWMFTAFHMGHYTPLTWLTLGGDYLLWGMNPRGYHLTSLLLHAATAIGFLFVSRRLVRAGLGGAAGDPAVRIGAAAAALIFAVHPLRVESVVWLSERRDVVSGLFYMLTVLAYLRATDERPGSEPGRSAPGWYWAAVALFICALLSKALVVTLPLVLIILDIYPLRRLGGAAGWTGPVARRIWIEKAPFLVLGAAGSILAFLARAPLGAAPGLDQFAVVSRAATSVYGLAFYLWKTVYPLHLSPLYEMPPSISLLSAWLVASTIAVLSLALLAVAGGRRWPAFTAASFAYLVTLTPVLGVVQSGPQITADRYSYLACLGWAVLFGGGLAWCAERWMSRSHGRLWHAAALSLGAILVAGAASLAARQSLVWQNSFALWTHALALDPTGPRAHAGLAAAFFAEGRRDAADHELEVALRLNPVLPEALMGLALTRSLAGRGDEAAQYAMKAVRLVPGDATAYRFLGEILGYSGKPEAALAAYRVSARLDPRAPTTRYAIAVKLAQLGWADEALAALAEADRLARAVNSVDAERDRFAALVYSRIDPERSREAWARYLTALGKLKQPTHTQLVRMVEAITALEEIEGKTSRAGSER